MKGRTNSVLNTNAQIKKPCYVGAVAMATKETARHKLEANRARLGRYYELGLLMYYTGCRITEALNIEIGDITERGDVYIKGLKGSDNRLVTVQVIADFMVKAKRNQVNPFHHMNRFSAYRLYKQIGIGKLKKGRFHMSITHSFRDDFVKNTRSIEMSERDRSKSIGHKSTNSTEYYGKD